MNRPAPKKFKGNSKPSSRDQGSSVPKNWRAICGNHAIQECLQVRAGSIRLAIFKQGWESSQDLKDLHKMFTQKNIKIEIKPPTNLDKISTSHQGVVVYSDVTPEADWEKIQNKKQSLVILLDGIEDPHNLGAIMRTSWLMGADAIILPKDRAVSLTATVHKVASGGVEHIPLEVVSSFQSLLEDLKEKGYWIYGLDHKGKNTLFQMKLSDKVIWCIGAEDKGLRSTTQNFCDELVRIPQVSANASYNASVAAAIAMAETRRQFIY